MPGVVQITEPTDPRVEIYRTVRDPALVRKQGVFIAESREVVRRLLACERYVTRSVFVTPAALAALELGGDGHDGPTIYVAEREVLEGVTGYEIHRGCVAVGEIGEGTRASDLFGAPLLVGLEAVTDPDNVGSIFRTAHALGVGGVLLSRRSVEPLYRKAIRTSMGATLDLPYARLDPWLEGLAEARAAGYRILAVTPGDATVPIAELAAAEPQPTLLLLGNEGDGLSAETRHLADARVEIPMANPVDSMNVGVAAGIAIYLFAGG